MKNIKYFYGYLVFCVGLAFSLLITNQLLGSGDFQFTGGLIPSLLLAFAAGIPSYVLGLFMLSFFNKILSDLYVWAFCLGFFGILASELISSYGVGWISNLFILNLLPAVAISAIYILVKKNK